MKTLILGMGNTLLSDDGIGIIVKRYLEYKFYGAEEIDFVETSWGGFKIVDLLGGYDYAVIVDSIKTDSEPLGYIHHLQPSALLPTLRLTSYHDINFITALKLAETIHAKVPHEIDIYAIEIENNYTISEQISPDLWQTIPECACKIAVKLADKHILPNNYRILNTDDKLDKKLISDLYGEKYLEHRKSEEKETLTI